MRQQKNMHILYLFKTLTKNHIYKNDFTTQYFYAIMP